MYYIVTVRTTAYTVSKLTINRLHAYVERDNLLCLMKHWNSILMFQNKFNRVVKFYLIKGHWQEHLRKKPVI